MTTQVNSIGRDVSAIMDRLKYRVWDNYAKKYVDGFCLALSPNGRLRVEHYSGALHSISVIDNRYVVERSTGLRDKNNNLIYEHDLVKDQFGAIYQVIWQDDFASFYLMLQSGHPEFIARIFEDEILEIIGNIHNKEQKQ